jgi:hypothetical protein
MFSGDPSRQVTAIDWARVEPKTACGASEVIQARAPAHDKEIDDSALRYLMRADDSERRKWGERAVELGFPVKDLSTKNSAVDLLRWLPLVRDEMQEQGLWKPPEEPAAEPETAKPTAKIIQLPLWPELAIHQFDEIGC